MSTLLLDVVKGALPVLAALHWSGTLTASIAGIVAMLGHGYPVLLGFGGGKGVATGAGAALALFPAGVGLAALAWAIVFFSLRYVSLASLASGAAFLVAAIALGSEWPVIAFAALAFGFVTLAAPRQHRAPARGNGAARAFAPRVIRAGFVTTTAWIVAKHRPHWGCARIVAQG